MPYAAKADLPDAVQKLPAHQQDVFMAAFNAAWEQHQGDEETCFKIAWAAASKAKAKGAQAAEETTIMAHDPAVYWNAEEVNTLSVLQAAEVRKDNGKPYSWHPLVPVGDFHHPKFGKLSFTADDVAEFAANFRAGVRGSDIPVDEIGAHESTPHGAAYGWLEDVEIKADGLWGKIGWNKPGQEVLAEDEFRYISPTLHTRALPFTAKDGSKVGNVVKSICLTNRPVFKGQPTLTVNMAEYEADETGESGTGGQVAPGARAETIEAATDERSNTMITDGTQELAEAQAAEAAEQADKVDETEDTAATAADTAEAEVDVAALTAERDGLLAEVQTLKDQIAGLEQATVTAAEPQAVDATEPPSAEALKLAEVERELQTIKDERALELAERQYRDLELEGNKRLGKGDVELYAKVHRALPTELAAAFAEHVSGGGPTFVQFGEVGIASGTHAAAPADGRKLYEKAVKENPDAALTDKTVDAVVKFGEGKEFEDFDALYAAWHEDGKPGLK
jgi:cation transport regulator